QRFGERIAARGRLGSPVYNGHSRHSFAGGVGLEPHVAGVEVCPPGLVGPEPGAGGDADGGEPVGEVLADRVSQLAVGGEADDGHAGAGLGVAAESVTDRLPSQLTVTWAGGEVHAGEGEV